MQATANVISLQQYATQKMQLPLAGLVDMFAHCRRGKHDPFWLKENAELVQILAATQASVTPSDLAPYEDFAAGVMKELRFFPQYYRLFLSIALDLDKMGLPNVPVQEMAEFIHKNALYDIELSDTHRSESFSLLARAGIDASSVDPTLNERLTRFFQNSKLFSLPNRRAAYDLFHIVFHKTDYGRREIEKDIALRLSLMNAGMVAWLEDNLDLLSEVVISLRLCGEDVPNVWADAITSSISHMEFSTSHDNTPINDEYHQYFVMNWAASTIGKSSFGDMVPTGATLIRQGFARINALQELSMALFEMGETRQPDWAQTRWKLWKHLSYGARKKLEVLEEFEEFEGFFEEFSRSNVGGRL